MICMTPRAFALETIALLKPDSCQAIAFARPAGTPCCAAICAICDELTRSGVGLGAAGGTIGSAGAGAAENKRAGAQPRRRGGGGLGLTARVLQWAALARCRTAGSGTD